MGKGVRFKVQGERLKVSERGYWWGKWVVVGVLLLIMAGWLVKDYGNSQVIGQQNRFSLVLASPEGSVSFVSFDPVEKRIFVLPFPANLSIKSRSVGEYSIASLYKIGQYDSQGGEFVRRKVQGFMRVPIPGYLVVAGELRSGLLKSVFYQETSSNLSTLDTLTLWLRAGTYTQTIASEDELVRSGVLEKKGEGYQYRAERLQQYVETRLFDWIVGESGVTVAIINMSGIDGMGSDMADFVNNLGLDVVGVRTGSGLKDDSRVLVSADYADSEATELLQQLLDLPTPEVGNTEEYRAEIVIEVGQDAKELF